MPDSLDSPTGAAAIFPATRPFYWSVRREIWENRSIYIAPIAVRPLFLFGFLVSMPHLPRQMRAALTLDPAQQHQVIEQPYDSVAVLLMLHRHCRRRLYCLDALHGERRDRSILFWKSLPVSDITMVLSKASIPLVVLPLFIFATTIAMQCVMLLLSTAMFGRAGLALGHSGRTYRFFHMSVTLFYHLIGVHAVCHAPIYGWLLLVSGWARRAAFMWAAFPALAIGIVEKIAFNTTYFGELAGRPVGGRRGCDYRGRECRSMPDTRHDGNSFAVRVYG